MKCRHGFSTPEACPVCTYFDKIRRTESRLVVTLGRHLMFGVSMLVLIVVYFFVIIWGVIR
jgi:hypothetical protein